MNAKVSKKSQNGRQKNNVKNSTKTGKNDLQKAQIYANLRKFPQKYAETRKNQLQFSEIVN